VNIRLLRHATAVLSLGGKRLLVDPMLGPAASMPPVPTRGAGRGRRNPLLDLPISAAELASLLGTLDALLLTHLHFDHFDDFEREILPRSLPVLCRPADAVRLRAHGFREVQPIPQAQEWKGLRFTRFEACHGGFLVRRLFMGKGSSYLVEAPGEPLLWVSGDTVWSRPVRRALSRRPGAILANCGAARIPFGRSITMGAGDLDRICRAAPQARVVAVHMEALNHCALTRDGLRRAIQGKPYQAAVRIPNDGETVEL
jgi:L-ascorbate metabolism protein UlaG (beta-lactamase superfamily)